MTGFRASVDFERGLVAGVHRMRLSISQVEMKFGFSRAIIA